MNRNGLFLVDIGFLNFGIWDVLDIAIVTYLIYRIYKLLKGGVAFSIFAGLFTLYIIWWLVNALHMQLVSNILSQFASVGVILLIVVFQPEIRRFLLDLGQSTFGSRLDPIKRWLNINIPDAPTPTEKQTLAREFYDIIRVLRNKGRDAVFVLTDGIENLKMTGGVELDTPFNRQLIESLLLPDSGLRQGAIVIDGKRIAAAGVRFPHSESDDLPGKATMRHRMGLGATEIAEVASIVISSNDQTISSAFKGYLAYDISEKELERFIEAHTE